MLGTNKNRIYMAFYARTDEKFHMGLLVMPKTVAGNEKTTWRLHAINRPDPSRRIQQRWDYEGDAVPARTPRILALVLLGKTEMSGRSVSDLLGAYVKPKQDDPMWNCKLWVFSAIEFLRIKAIIPAGLSPCQLYDVGARVAREEGNLATNDRLARPVPTRDAVGQVIPSEVK
ncbi:hypothetical protein ONZ45_g16707 [Pleurotus djamor]|nr:hypothetical protein ONZ45_g16707 [Pleurotus djamor]